MNSPDSRTTTRQGMSALVMGVMALMAYGTYIGGSDTTLVGYGVLVAACVLPAFLWVSRGARGIPVFAAFALAHVPYFALPVVRSSASISMYDEDEILTAALTIALFLVAATVANFAGVPRRPPKTGARDPRSEERLRVLILLGLVAGLLFQLGTIAGMLWWLETFYGVARSLALTFSLVASYCLGIAAGEKLLTPRQLAAGFLLLAANTLLSWTSLYLVGGALFLLSCFIGYVAGSGKVPWKTFVVAFAVVSVLQAGKRDMRETYWSEGMVASIADLPGRLIEWADRGAGVLATRTDDVDVARPEVLDRTSLLQMMLVAQRFTPGTVDYLKGETYMLLPQVLLPRFILPDKPSSQEGMNRLNVAYGLLPEDEEEHTAVGWGLASEAFANFGYGGVVAMGLFIGLLCRTATYRSMGRAPAALPSMLAVAVLLGLVNMEADFTGMALSLLQSCVAVLVFHATLKALLRRDAKKRGRQARAPAFAQR